MMPLHPLDFLTLGVIVLVIFGLLWMTYTTWRELNRED
jgi:hypothetical protein